MFEWKNKNQFTLMVVACMGLWACGGANTPAAGDKSTGVATAATPAGEAQSQTSDFFLGQPRDDSKRFFGVYGDAAHPGELRGQFFVTEAKRPKLAEQAPEIPPGYLAIGAMWADVAPMNMKSLSEASFQQVDLGSFALPPATVTFEFGPDGKAIALTFTTQLEEFGRRVRLGDLPEGWGK